MSTIKDSQSALFQQFAYQKETVTYLKCFSTFSYETETEEGQQRFLFLLSKLLSRDVVPNKKNLIGINDIQRLNNLCSVIRGIKAMKQFPLKNFITRKSCFCRITNYNSCVDFSNN